MDRPSGSFAGNEEVEFSQKIDGIMVGVLVSCTDEKCLVEYGDGSARAQVTARSVVKVTADDVGRLVVLVFEQGCPDKPIIMGVIQSQSARLEEILLDQILGMARQVPSITVDEKRIELSANREVVLKCGKASITLTRAGKVLIRGEYVLTRATGVNRVKGGSVQIN